MKSTTKKIVQDSVLPYTQNIKDNYIKNPKLTATGIKLHISRSKVGDGSENEALDRSTTLDPRNLVILSWPYSQIIWNFPLH